MAQQISVSGQSTRPTPDDLPHADPWLAFGYLVSGVLVYGAVGWGLDRWWGTSFLVAVGIVAGAGLGAYQTFARFRAPGEEPAQAPPAGSTPSPPPTPPTAT